MIRWTISILHDLLLNVYTVNCSTAILGPRHNDSVKRFLPPSEISLTAYNISVYFSDRPLQKVKYTLSQGFLFPFIVINIDY